MAKQLPFTLGDIVWHAMSSEEDQRGKVVGITHWIDGAATFQVMWPSGEIDGNSAYELTATCKREWEKT